MNQANNWGSEQDDSHITLITVIVIIYHGDQSDGDDHNDIIYHRDQSDCDDHNHNLYHHDYNDHHEYNDH